MKSRQVESYLSNKLGYSREERRHIHFAPQFRNGKVALPTVIALPRGSGDIGDNVVRNIADALGLREKDFRISTECRIGAACVYICQAGYCVRHCCTSLVADPQVHRENVMGLQISIMKLLHQANVLMRGARQWNPAEYAAMNHVIKRIEQAGVPAELQETVAAISSLISKYDDQK